MAEQQDTYCVKCGNINHDWGMGTPCPHCGHTPENVITQQMDFKVICERIKSVHPEEKSFCTIFGKYPDDPRTVFQVYIWKEGTPMLIWCAHLENVQSEVDGLGGQKSFCFCMHACRAQGLELVADLETSTWVPARLK